ncbi:hypothetical protein [Duganella sp.]|uniref:hypothetical protein n=1 Tax=Duganella sp. TaxID=1904440 RepID=UPI0031CE86CC
MKFWASLLLLLSAGAHAAEACQPVRVGYSDRERLPYYVGNGPAVPTRPGALVELFRDAVRSGGCPVVFVRLPVARVRMALASGQIDIAPTYTPGDSRADYVVATTAAGAVDTRRALRSMAIVFVRSDDKLAPGTDPQRYFKTHVLAANQGTMLASQLKTAGLQVDDGSVSSESNFDKLRLKRVDGFTVALMTPSALDPYLNEHHGKQLTRLDKPLSVSYVWLGANRDYYQRNREQVEAIWNWLGAHGAPQLDTLTRKYAAAP